MCYLCMKDDIFDALDAHSRRSDRTKLENLRMRGLIIKWFLKIIDDDEGRGAERCADGDATVERLKEEQHRIAREM